MGNENENFTLKFWFEGNFKRTGVGLEYLNGQFYNLPIDPDLISWFEWASPPRAKRPRGRPKKASIIPIDAPNEQPMHHTLSAQPSEIGRRGKTLKVGQGSRGFDSGRGGIGGGAVRERGSGSGRGGVSGGAVSGMGFGSGRSDVNDGAVRGDDFSGREGSGITSSKVKSRTFGTTSGGIFF